MCGETVSAYIRGDSHFEPCLLDLRSRSINTHDVTLNTYSSPVTPVRDPDLCVFREYIDNDQTWASRATGNCASHPFWALS